ncbi:MULTISPECIES: DUF975 family protein [unclassified Enterococcus]|jgi:uncharacterized membrane protein|uniref:DUF975 family protein n=1 Tax=unclassified Enterococcus TaxID=2608891 RepID=UPI000353728D|nr:hypothetical protein D920_00905 [Enterococcus faecalis 13-SD-W-01]
MKTSSELKAEARAELKGRWGQAVLLNLVPTLIGILIALIVMVPLFLFLYRNGVSMDSTTTDGAGNGSGSGSSLVSTILNALFLSGISWTYLDLLRGTKTNITPFQDAFRGFKSPYFGGVFGIAVLTTIFTFLWSLLLVIPGIIKGYSYSQSTFIYYDTIQATGEKPRVLDTITASRRLMKGYKGKLFWLDLSFIGWHLLSMLTLGIGYLWLLPYITATKAAFYNDLPKETVSI